MVISEFDSAVDSASVKEMYLQRFTHPKNKMVWYGNAVSKHDSIQYLSMKLEEQKISTGSHMSPLFAPDNAYYGVSGERRMCKTRFKKQTAFKCNKNNQELWFAAWGYQEEGKKHTRLTWSTYYSELESQMFNIVN